MKPIKLAAALCLLVPFASQAKFADFTYDYYSVQVDCELKLPTHVSYTLSGETKKVIGDFTATPGLKSQCQQNNFSRYRDKYHQGGFFVHQRVFDAIPSEANQFGSAQARYITNTWPMAINLSAGAWKRISDIEQCYALSEDVTVHAGMFPTEKPANENFLFSHGIQTPSAFWKVLVREGKVAAYIFPNNQEPLADKANAYLVSIREIEKRAGILLPIVESLKDQVAPATWVKLTGC